jgi:hypothetical protein
MLINQQERVVEKTKYELKPEVVTAQVMPRTLQPHTELMPFHGETIEMYAVYGRTDDDKRVWCATFIDRDEASAWCQASKTFGRAVTGAVIAKQEEPATDA